MNDVETDVSRRSERGDTLAIQIRAPLRERDRLIAELHALGTLGIEELEDSLVAWFRAADAPCERVEGLADPLREIRVEPPRLQPERDWQQLWRRGLGARQVAGLWIRPSFVASRGAPELIIDPEQAFGTGEHATTRLALALLIESLSAGECWLDLGSGSGILSLAALRLGVRRAVALEIDPVASATAKRNARRNGLAPQLVCGSLDALRVQRSFDGAVANLLWSRLRPLLQSLEARVRGRLILSGYLARERDSVSRATASLGLETLEERREAQSGELWCARLVQASVARQASSRASSVSSKA